MSDETIQFGSFMIPSHCNIGRRVKYVSGSSTAEGEIMAIGRSNVSGIAEELNFVIQPDNASFLVYINIKHCALIK